MAAIFDLADSQKSVASVLGVILKIPRSQGVFLALILHTFYKFDGRYLVFSR